MKGQNHLRLVAQYQQHRQVIHGLIESMMTSISSPRLLDDYPAQLEAVQRLSEAYPFVELIYSLDGNAVQRMDSAYGPNVSERKRRSFGRGADRSHRPYVQVSRDCPNRIVVTDPYLSCATQQLAISAVHHFVDEQGVDLGYLVININLQRLIAYLNGDEMRSKVHPFFQLVYGVIGALLVVVSVLLLYASIEALVKAVSQSGSIATHAFGTVILITLGMAIFDLGKTIIEEEVLLNKDIHHHDSTRRTITRFMSAIVIAVSIEALLLMFKTLLGEGSQQIVSAVWMLLAAVGLLGGLGLYLKLSREQEA
ncbi:hypothetical protein BZL41_12640 [Pseudomonas sp. PIC25]|uniref:hypothetical protein n=1 Tax=Pseudomonas sp. PIC25 TaxID=1958773 RepID=UPI000BAB9FE7|nr:hypothetical protein [Pseudomonas sp. PIC25]PAU63241.1 hypothetical protein BZL41_12640 [Pseudomonas sp. PIC25]